MSRHARRVGTVVLTAAAVAYLVWKINLSTTLDVLADVSPAWFALAAAIMFVTVPVLAARWGWLLAAHGMSERLRWLTRAYFVAYAAGQVLPTSLGGDAVRVVETSRRHAGRTAVVTGTILLERGLGGAATVLLGAVGFVLSIGHYDVSAYLWLEGVFVFGTLVLGFLFFARSARPLLRRVKPQLERLRLAGPLESFYEGVHHYRGRPRLLAEVFGVTLAVQAVRILSIWAVAKAVGIDLDVRVYYVMGPLLFLVMLVPFTLNGIAVREAFFVSFLGSLGVGADQAFAAGFLYFLVILLLVLPGGVILVWEGLRGGIVLGSSMASDASVAAVVVTYDALPWIERCLESLRDVETVVVDNGSQDGTADFVRERFPEARLIEAENRGLGAGWNVGLRATSSRYALLLNADAWLVEGALDRLVGFADTRPGAAVIGPRLLNQDGTLQRSVRGFPTLWRLATEYFFLRKLAPGSSALNAFYAGGFEHDEVRDVEVVMGACMLVRREAVAEVGYCDEDYFLFSEETDWCFRFREAGWEVVFFPGAECVHVRGAAHGGHLYRENLKGHLLFLSKHRGPKAAERARWLLLVALKLRGLVFRGASGRSFRDGAAWLASGNAATLIER